MKILVDEMPTHPKECLFNTSVLTRSETRKNLVTWHYGCHIDNKDCDLEKEGKCGKLSILRYHKQDKGEWRLTRTFSPIGSTLTYGVFVCSNCGFEKNFVIQDEMDSIYDYECVFDNCCNGCGAKMND
jgi:transcription elongation factor Elf1